VPRLDLNALERVMRRRNFLFKHQLANLVGISYERLTAIIAHRENEVDEEIVARLCSGLGCPREEIVTDDPPNPV
jgi:DNA-binding Xre family transcriptional regulator